MRRTFNPWTCLALQCARAERTEAPMCELKLTWLLALPSALWGTTAVGHMVLPQVSGFRLTHTLWRHVVQGGRAA